MTWMKEPEEGWRPTPNPRPWESADFKHFHYSDPARVKIACLEYAAWYAEWLKKEKQRREDAQVLVLIPWLAFIALAVGLGVWLSENKIVWFFNK